MKNIFASAKNNIIHKDEHYVRFEFVEKYLTPVQLLQMGIDDYAEMLQTAQQSVQRTGDTRRKIRHSSNHVGGKHDRR
jgi:FtsZ-binding cell division protein ZapB